MFKNIKVLWKIAKLRLAVQMFTKNPTQDSSTQRHGRVVDEAPVKAKSLDTVDAKKRMSNQ